MQNNQNYATRGKQVFMNTYNRFPIAFVKGSGVTLTDADGKNYLDFVSGIAVNSLGYANKALNDALKAQMKQHFTDDAITEMTALIAFQNLSARFNAALDIPSQGLCDSFKGRPHA